MRIGLIQLNTIVGDFSGNAEKILHAYHSLCQQGADLVLTPELSLCGYPPRDLIPRSGFAEASLATLHKVAQQTSHIPLLLGFISQNPSPNQKKFFNSAAWCANASVQHITHKILLPYYSIFEEERHFQPGSSLLVVPFQGKNILVTICEDIWASSPHNPAHYSHDPLSSLSNQNIDLILNLSASPWHRDKFPQRLSTLQKTAANLNAPIAYCNLSGANDEIIFDGRSTIAYPSGAFSNFLPAFQESNQILDLNAPPTHPSIPKFSEFADLHSALLLGIRDYTQKSGFSKVILGLSGGIDSALVALLASQALGPSNVLVVALPSQFSSNHSRQDALNLAKNLGLKLDFLDIQPTVDSIESSLAPLFHSLPKDITEENIQSRTRGLFLMALSNKFNALLLNTGNKSEYATGYCTLYGDMAGALAPLGDLTKTRLYQFCHYLNSLSPLIPPNILSKPPSAELRPNQTDQDSLPPYPLLDSIIEAYEEQNLSPDQIITQNNLDPKLVYDTIKLIHRNEYKRKQSAPILKVTPHAFGIGRRIPIVNKFF